MTTERAGGWRWANVPVPEPHVGGLVAGAVLQLLHPRPFVVAGPVRWPLGGALLVGGIAVVAWTVRTAGDTPIEPPARLVTTGPYRYSRNPMYVAWTGLYVGIALVGNAAWPLLLLPVVLAAVHAIVRREERALERRFGAEYRRYRRDVRRYL